MLSSEESPSRTGMPGTAGCSDLTTVALYMLQTEAFVWTRAFFFSSPPGWANIHHVAEGDSEPLILAPAPPVLGFRCAQACPGLWAAGDQTQGLVRVRHTLFTTETQPQPVCTHLNGTPG